MGAVLEAENTGVWGDGYPKGWGGSGQLGGAFIFFQPYLEKTMDYGS